MSPRRGACMLLLLLAPACHTSPQPVDAARASDNRGVLGVVDVGGTMHYGELLSVDDSAVVVLLATGRIAVVPVQRTGVRVSFPEVAATSGDRAQLSPEDMQKARAASRFPYGVPPAAMRELLARAGQAAPDTLRASAP